MIGVLLNIRAGLPPADRGHFDKDYRQAMAKATEELDLSTCK